MISLEQFNGAQERLSRFIAPTPLICSGRLTEKTGVWVGLKCEHYQTTGSFKLRGATNFLLRLHAAKREKGVITVSTGNHGRGLSHAAKMLGVKAVVCMSQLVPQNKIDGIRSLGAEVRIVGKSQDDAMDAAEQMALDEGLTYVQPFDHPDIIAGQGTIGLEIVRDVPDVETVIIQLSGGGLSAGVGQAVKHLRPNSRVIGVTMENGAAMKASFDAGHPVRVEEVPSLADSLGGGIGLDNRYTYKMCKAVLDDVVLLTEREIADGIRHAYQQEREIVEGAGAVGIAALISSKVKNLRGPVAVLISGRNIDMNLHHHVINGGNSVLVGNS
jgi:threonine dehydratase